MLHRVFTQTEVEKILGQHALTEADVPGLHQINSDWSVDSRKPVGAQATIELVLVPTGDPDGNTSTHSSGRSLL